MSFFRKYVWHNAGLKLVSVAAAVLLWAAVAREPITEVAINVPIEFENVPDQLEISSETIPQAQVRVRGPARLVRDASPTAVHCEVDLTGSKPGQRTYELGPSRIQAPRGLQVTQVIPTRLQLDLDRRMTRVVEVHPRVIGQFASGIRIGRVMSEPARVTIIGPEKRILALDSATTDPVDATGVVGTQTFTSHVYVTDSLVRVVYTGPVHVIIQTEKSPVADAGTRR